MGKRTSDLIAELTNRLLELLPEDKELFFYTKMQKGRGGQKGDIEIKVKEELDNLRKNHEQDINDLNKILEFKIKIIEVENNEIIAVINKDREKNLIKLFKLIYDNKKIIMNCISKSNNSNKIKSAFKEYEKVKDFDEFQLSITSIVYFLLAFSRVLGCNTEKRVTITDNKNESFMLKKEDIKSILSNKYESIFREKPLLNLNEFTYYFFEECLKNFNIPREIKRKLNILLKGVPGTGKSRAIDKYIEGIFEKKNILRINVHSASSNADLMQGIGVYLTKKEEKIKYTEKRGLILNFILKAICTPKKEFALILEEIQENSLNELIGDLIYLIEDEKRTSRKYIDKFINETDKDDYEKFVKGQISESKRLEEIYRNIYDIINNVVENEGNIYYVQMPQLIEDDTKFNKLILPDNLHIFCTTNYREDRKIIEDNLFRRFEVIDIYPDESKIEDEVVSNFFKRLNDSIIEVMQQEDDVHPDRYLIGHANWMYVKEPEQFFRAFLKLINEFKEIRQIEYNIFKQIINKTQSKKNTDNLNNNNSQKTNGDKNELTINKDKNNDFQHIENIKDAENYVYKLIKDDKFGNYYKLIRNLSEGAKYEISQCINNDGSDEK